MPVDGGLVDEQFDAAVASVLVVGARHDLGEEQRLVEQHFHSQFLKSDVQPDVCPQCQMRYGCHCCCDISLNLDL